MAVTGSGEFSGSVSGGCVESAVIEASLKVLETGAPQLLHYGVTDETAWGVGLACGGSLDVFVEPLDPADFDFLAELLNEERPVASVTLVDGDPGRKLIVDLEDTQRQRGDGDLQEQALRFDKPSIAEVPFEAESAQAFVDVIAPPPTLIVIGGVQISIALSRLAETMGYRTVIVDPRRAFARLERFPGVDRVIQAWPEEAFKQFPLNRSTAVVTLTHDPKIDEPALMLALRSEAFYIGALGSRRTQSRRRARLKENGLNEELLDRLHGPVGIELGADTPEDIALSIMAEIVASKNSLRS
jgi:xanthine dehydrogenase accessory factor